MRSSARSKGGVFWLVLSACMAWASVASAQTERYALVLGNNHGEPEDVELQFADDDARNFASVLMRFGDLEEDHLELLINASATQAEAALGRLNKKIAREHEASPDSEILLTVYYSGHADRTSLHMEGTHLSFDRIKALLDGSPANLKVLIVDACSSGELTRVKGAKPAPPFELSALEENTSQGLAIITSATAGENAQESDRLEGSFFTHHLLAGLLGAADSSGDQEITLTEAYQYAYRETLRATSRLPSIQHPTYSFALRGRRDVVLTRIYAKHKAYGYLELEPVGRFVIFKESAQGELVAEFATTKRTRLILKAGDYFVRWRDEDIIHEASVEIVAPRETTKLSRADFTQIPYAQVVRKGSVDMVHEPASTSLALMLTGGVIGESVEGTGAPWLMRAGLHLDMPVMTGQLNVRLGESSNKNDIVSLNQRLLGVELVGLKSWDVGRGAVGVGAGAGIDWVHQEFDTAGQAPDRDAFTPFLGPRALVSWSLTPRLNFVAGGSFDLVFTTQQDDAAVAPQRKYVLVPGAHLGVSAAFF